MKVLKIKEKIDKGETVTIPTTALGMLMADCDMHDLNVRWEISVMGRITKIKKG